MAAIKSDYWYQATIFLFRGLKAQKKLGFKPHENQFKRQTKPVGILNNSRAFAKIVKAFFT